MSDGRARFGNSAAASSPSAPRARPLLLTAQPRRDTTTGWPPLQHPPRC